MTEKELTISEKLDKLMANVDTKEKKKQFKLPIGIRASKGKIKKNFAVVLIIRTNGAVDIKFVQIEDNTIKIGDTYYEATAKYVLRYKRYPMIILPEWNITPVSKPEEEVFDSEKNLQEAIEKGKLSAAEKFILHAIKMDLVKQKPQLSMKMVIGLVAALGIGYYLLSSGGMV